VSLLEIRNISLHFDGLVAVDNVSLHVDEGEIISVIGPNGAGKTTVFNILTGVYKATSGEVIFNGQPIHGLDPRRIVELGIARTFQNIRLFKDMRVIENVLVGDHKNIGYNFFDLIFKTPRYRKEERKSHQKALDILESIGLAGHAEKYAKNLPYGLQRRLEIARAMATGTRFLILDEPAAGMNPQESGDLLDFIRKLRSGGLTILLIEHDMSVVMNISDRVYVLDHGKLIAEGAPGEIVADKNVIEAYLGQEDQDA
jgi:branched-chain amino acid transport system ATP-binding protein